MSEPGGATNGVVSRFNEIHEGRVVIRDIQMAHEAASWMADASQAHPNAYLQDYYQAALHLSVGQLIARGRDCDIVFYDGAERVAAVPDIRTLARDGLSAVSIALHVQDNQLALWAGRERQLSLSKVINRGVQILGAWSLHPELKPYIGKREGDELVSASRFPLPGRVPLNGLRPLDVSLL